MIKLSKRPKNPPPPPKKKKKRRQGTLISMLTCGCSLIAGVKDCCESFS